VTLTIVKSINIAKSCVIECIVVVHLFKEVGHVTIVGIHIQRKCIAVLVIPTRIDFIKTRASKEFVAEVVVFAAKEGFTIGRIEGRRHGGIVRFHAGRIRPACFYSWRTEGRIVNALDIESFIFLIWGGQLSVVNGSSFYCDAPIKYPVKKREKKLRNGEFH